MALSGDWPNQTSLTASMAALAPGWLPSPALSRPLPLVLLLLLANNQKKSAVFSARFIFLHFIPIHIFTLAPSKLNFNRHLHSFIHSFNHATVHPSIHPSIHSFIHSHLIFPLHYLIPPASLTRQSFNQPAQLSTYTPPPSHPSSLR